MTQVDIVEGRAGRRGQVVRQLPADVPGFTGRAGHLARLDAVLAGGAVAVAAVSGMPGVGKTALAVHWAHRVADRFADGQLYVNLRGFDPSGSVMGTDEAIQRLLDALGVAPRRVPPDLDARVATYRREVAGRRVLILLDNAHDLAQVRPLLPGAPGCLVLLTSRSRLPGLSVARDVHPIALDVLTEDEAREFLVRRLGADRVAAEPAAVEEIIDHSARLPLALAVAAARVATDPRLPLHGLAGQLREVSLDALAATDDPRCDVRVVFSSSYRTLSTRAARLFRQLGPHPGPDIGLPAAASLAGVPARAVRTTLDELTQASLLVESVPGRYTLHDLLRAYAADLAATADPRTARRAAIARLLDHYLHTAHAAERLLDPATDPVALGRPARAVTPEPIADRRQALDWFTVEHPVLLAAVVHAGASGWHARCGQLAWTLSTFLDRLGHWHDLATVGRAAVAAAGHLADPVQQGRARRVLAHAGTRLGRFAEAETLLRQALDLYCQAGDPVGRAHTHSALGHLSAQRNRPAKALDHAQQALALHRAAGHRTGQARALTQVGRYHAVLGHHRQALTCGRQALALQPGRSGQAHALDSLGYAHQKLGNHTQALTCYLHALDLHRELGNHYDSAVTLTHLGDLHRHSGALAAAARAWQQALIVFDDLENPGAAELRAKLGAITGEPSTGSR